jgi:uncharacterized membrane protein
MAMVDPLPEPPATDAAGVATVGEGTSTRRSRLVLAGFLVFMGVLHFAVPKPFDKIVPRWVPGAPRFWTLLSGACELSSGVLLALPRTKRIGASLAAATMVVVYPANIQMAVDNPPNTAYGIGLLARLPLQFPIVAWALKHAKRS